MDEQVKIISKMTPEEKFKIATDMYWTARGLKTAWLKQLHPDWSDEEVEKVVREIFLCARS